MKRFLLCAALAAVAVPARPFDGAVAARRMGALLPHSSDASVLLQSLATPSPAPSPAAQSIFPPGLWDSLQALDQRTLVWLALRDPGLVPAQARELPFETADLILSAAAARGLTGLDIFTDPDLRGARVYYLSGETLSRLFQKYDLRILTISEGRDVHGKPFRLQGALAGGGKVVMLYDRDKFHFANPYYTDFHYQSESRIVYTILGDADVAIEGLKVDGYGLVHPRITRARKTRTDQMHVDTTLMSEDKPLWPVMVRTDAAGRP